MSRSLVLAMVCQMAKPGGTLLHTNLLYFWVKHILLGQQPYHLVPRRIPCTVCWVFSLVY